MDPRERDAKHAKEQQKRELLDRAFERVIGSQLTKLAGKRTVHASEEELYKQTLALEREKAQTRKPKKLSEHERHQTLAFSATGLSGQVVALMARTTHSDNDDSDNNDSDNSDEDEKKRKRRRHSKKKKSKRRDESSRKRKKRYSSSSSEEDNNDDNKDDGSSDSEDERERRKRRKKSSSSKS
eukprot:scaffold174129_cov28-Attheya_sp.AAC.1